MKKIVLLVMSILLLTVLLTGCAKSDPITEKEEKTRDIRIQTINVLSAVENEDHIYRLEYP